MLKFQSTLLKLTLQHQKIPSLPIQFQGVFPNLTWSMCTIQNFRVSSDLCPVVFCLRNLCVAFIGLNVKQIIAVIDATFAVAERKPEKKIRLVRDSNH